MRKTPEAGHDVAVQPRVAQVLVQRGVAERRGLLAQALEAAHGLVLQGQRLGVHQGHVEEHTGHHGQALVLAAGHGRVRERLGARIAGEGARLAAEQVARQLVQQEHQGQAAQGRVGPIGQAAGQRFVHQGAVAVAQLLVLLGVETEPELVAWFAGPMAGEAVAAPLIE